MTKLPAYACNLANLYWMLRHFRSRSTAARRRYYRHILKEKNRLFLAGFDKKEIVLLCRHLANPRDIHAESAFLAYSSQYEGRPGFM